MNVFLEPSGRRIQPFDEPIGDTPIQNRPLRHWQAEALAEAGLEPIHGPTAPCLILPDNFFAAGAALKAFVDGAAGRDAVLVLKESRFGRATVPVQPGVVEVDGGWRFEAIRFVSGRGEAPVDVVVDPLEQPFDVPMPRQYVAEGLVQIGVALRPVMTLHHWIHILWCNQVAGGLEVRRTPKWKFILLGLWAILRARSLNKWKILGKFNRIGRGCDIHPTALVEGSTLGDGVVVGPYARVFFSHIGAGAIVMPAAQVDACVVGAGAIISEQCVMRFSVYYPECVASQLLMQACVVGRGAVVNKGSVSIDLNLDQDIRVALDGRMWSTGQRCVGSAYGHKVRIGTGFYLGAGRAIPNGYFLLRDPKQVLTAIPPDLPGVPLNASGHKAVPINVLLARGAPKEP